MILRELVRATFGPQARRTAPPIEGTFHLFGIDYDNYRVFAAVFAAGAMGLFFLFLMRTTLGTWIRAEVEERWSNLRRGQRPLAANDVAQHAAAIGEQSLAPSSSRSLHAVAMGCRKVGGGRPCTKRRQFSLV